jgi:hypothetical protein
LHVERSLRRCSEFFGHVVCRFVLQDVGVLLDKCGCSQSIGSIWCCALTKPPGACRCQARRSLAFRRLESPVNTVLHYHRCRPLHHYFRLGRQRIATKLPMYARLIVRLNFAACTRPGIRSRFPRPLRTRLERTYFAADYRTSRADKEAFSFRLPCSSPPCS